MADGCYHAYMSLIRTQVQLAEDQYRRLKSLAAARSQSVSQLVREGVDRLLEEAGQDRKWRRLLEVAGSVEDREGAEDVSQKHDEYLARIYGQG